MNLSVQTTNEYVAGLMNTPSQRAVSEFAKFIKELPKVELPLTHEFVPNMYIRTIKMPAGTVVVSKIHKTEHPYVITKGKVSVWIEGIGEQIIEAPHKGITKVGTRRVIFIHEDCEWTTFHPTNKTNLEEIEKDVIYNPEENTLENKALPIYDAHEHP